MDRLLCGDVGFGKTEVALRAVMKAVMDGKQVAILVPTTVLGPAALPDRRVPVPGLPGDALTCSADSARQSSSSGPCRNCAAAMWI